ncbi:MAG: DUF1080 domain-containing protein [Bryobacteraceae bacterium]|nr:DUF1080 domain-containing protein [Bryobacteraceae bacterium]
MVAASRYLLLGFATCTLGMAQSTPETALADAPFQKEQGWRPLLNGRDLSGWHSLAGWRGDPKRLNEWITTPAVALSDKSADLLVAKPGVGNAIVNGIATHTSNLVTDESFGDVELYLEFMVSKGSNSGVYLHGLYEVQIFDSWGAGSALKSGDAGGIYERWRDNKGFEGSAPRVNASRAPGEWQSYHIWFQAPRFEKGRKVSEAEFLKVVYNGVLVQANYRCTGPTRSGLEIPEASQNPIMLQGDHGPVAFRNIYLRPLRRHGSGAGSN